MKYLLLIILFPVICCDNGKRIGESNSQQIVSDTLYINDTLSLIVEGDYTYIRTYLYKNHWTDARNATRGGMTIDTVAYHPIVRPDTSRVIMLVSDTAKQIGDWVVLGRDVFWMAGYEVRIPEIYNEIQNGDYLGENRTCAVYGCTTNHWSKTIKVVTKSSEIIYLDENKNHLSKSLVIWDIKKLKQ